MIYITKPKHEELLRELKAIENAINGVNTKERDFYLKGQEHRLKSILKDCKVISEHNILDIIEKLPEDMDLDTINAFITLIQDNNYQLIKQI